jgi:hypothetical protein
MKMLIEEVFLDVRPAIRLENFIDSYLTLHTITNSAKELQSNGLAG